MVVPGNHRHPLGIYALSYRDAVANIFERLLTQILVVAGEGHLSEAAMRDEDSHFHAQVLHRLGDPILILDRTPLHPVVLPGREALVSGKLQLFHGIVASRMTKHAEMRSELHTKALRFWFAACIRRLNLTMRGGRNGRQHSTRHRSRQKFTSFHRFCSF